MLHEILGLHLTGRVSCPFKDDKGFAIEGISHTNRTVLRVMG